MKCQPSNCWRIGGSPTSKWEQVSGVAVDYTELVSLTETPLPLDMHTHTPRRTYMNAHYYDFIIFRCLWSNSGKLFQVTTSADIETIDDRENSREMN